METPNLFIFFAKYDVYFNGSNFFVPLCPSMTYSCVLSKPSTMWGTEVGINKIGVAMGNKAFSQHLDRGKI